MNTHNVLYIVENVSFVQGFLLHQGHKAEANRLGDALTLFRGLVHDD